MTERVRFTPSPSGLLHIGGARTALFDWLVAKRGGGTFILRVEDTDRARVTAESEAALLDDLRWLGVHWDEGPHTGGPHAPYRQSERGAHYERSLLALRRTGAVYPCFCPPERLDAERAEDLAAGRLPRYRRTCRRLTEDEAGRRIAAGEEAAWRFAVPTTRAIEWTDRVHGRQAFSSDELDDFVVVRADGQALSDLACVTDDAAMRVTLVLRDDGCIPNTARQLLLHEALGLVPPAFGHLPTVTDPEGAQLSGSAGESIRALRDEGFVPDAVVDHLARLGWSDPLGRPALSREELLAAFDLTRVSTAPRRHDPDTLRALNARHMRALSTDELVAAIAPHVPPFPDWLDPSAFAEAVRSELEVASDAYAPAVALIAPDLAEDETARVLREPQAALALEAALDAVAAAQPFGGEVAYRALCERLADLEPGRAHQAVRAGLTGIPDGLPLPTLFSLLGREGSAERLSRARATAAIDTADGGNG